MSLGLPVEPEVLTESVAFSENHSDKKVWRALEMVLENSNNFFSFEKAQPFN